MTNVTQSCLVFFKVNCSERDNTLMQTILLRLSDINSRLARGLSTIAAPEYGFRFNNYIL